MEFRLIVVLIFVGVIADILDPVFYQIFLRQNGIGWLSPVPMSMIWEYLKTPIGCTLTVLGLGPWLIILGLAYWPRNYD